jgi:hypothetical protein
MSVERNYRDSNGRGVAGGIDRCLTPPIRLLDFRGVPVERLRKARTRVLLFRSARLGSNEKRSSAAGLGPSNSETQDRLAASIAGLADFI